LPQRRRQNERHRQRRDRHDAHRRTIGTNCATETAIVAHLNNWRTLVRHLGRRNTLDSTIRAIAGLLSDHQYTERRKPVAALTAGPAA